MTVTAVRKDANALTMTLDAEFDASPERVWQLWADPRQLERWWGPPGYPATFTKHDLAPGSRVEYHMTTPEGEKPRGWWKFTAIDAPRKLEFDDGFADESGAPVDAMGSAHATVTLEDAGGRTRMTIMSTFESEEQMEEMVKMGMEEGMKEALGQVDAILAEHART